MDLKDVAGWSRRPVAGVLVVGALALLGWVGVPEVCAQQLPSTGSRPVDVCRPMGSTDPRVVLFLLVLGGLLLPDLAELEIGGVLRVRRRLDEVARETEQLQGEVTQVRAQMMTAVAAISTSRSSARVENYTVFAERSREVGKALAEVSGAGDGRLDPVEERGAYAAIAFEAGFYGLPRYLPDGMTSVAMAGYVFDGDDLALYAVAARGNESRALESALRGEPAPAGVDVSVAHDAAGTVVTAPALDARGLVVGAIAVRVPQQGGSDEQELLSSVELVARAYARLLIDVMGEMPREPRAGKATGEETE